MGDGVAEGIELGVIERDGQPTLVNPQSFACEPVDTTGDGLCNAVGFDTTGDGILNDIRQLPEGWKAMRDESGKLFFFHQPSGTSHKESPTLPSNATALQRVRSVSVSAAKSPQPRRLSTFPGEAGAQIRFVRHRSCSDVLVKTMLENRFLTILSVFLWLGSPFAIQRSVENFVAFSWQNYSEAGHALNSTAADVVEKDGGDMFDGIYFSACVIYVFLFVVTAGVCPPFALDKSHGGLCLRNGPHPYVMQPPTSFVDLTSYVKSVRDSTPECRIVMQVSCSHEENESTTVSFQDTKVFPTTGCVDSSDSVDGLIGEMEADSGHWYHIDFTYNFDFQTVAMQAELERAKAEYVTANEHQDSSCRATVELQGPKMRGPMLVAKDSPKLLARIFLNRCMLIIFSYLGLLLPYLFIYNLLSARVSFRCHKTFSC